MRRRWVSAATAAVLALGALAALALVQRSGREEAGRERLAEARGVEAFGSESELREHARGSVSRVERLAVTSPGPNVGTGTFQGVSPAVASLPVLPVAPVTQLSTRDFENLQPASKPSSGNDPVVQRKRGGGPLSGPLQSFDGICLPFGVPCSEASSCSCLPPDTNGEAGKTQFVQMVNTDFAVYSKTGQVLRTATPINQLWSGVGGECAAHNDGDPVVVYDQLADRWILSQFVARPGDGEQYGECFAVSTTGDATGTYYLYEFLFGQVSPSTFHDYPKLGVWRDAYYMSTNEFEDGQLTSKGAGAFAFERAKMLNGQPARFVFFDESLHNPIGGQYVGQLPSDLDGTRPPKAGEPAFFAEVDDPSGIPPTPPSNGFVLRLWKFHVDWTNPASSTFGVNGAPDYVLPVATFVRPQCVYGYGDCAVQKDGAQGLDVLGDRLMFRLAYRNFGDHESLVLNHSVKVETRIGIRWYEVRNPNASPAIYQQGTYAPDDDVDHPLSRWMGSVAMDKLGDLALGYSASGANDYPSLRYTGRAAGDAAGQMTQAEQVLFTGSGPQTELEGRWGDYSDLSVDPVDDCTFWFTSEYLGKDLLVIGTWRTRIGSFRFPGCK